MILENVVTTSGFGYLWYSLFLILGIFLLVKGADLFVGGASAISKKLKISALVIGLTVVSFGTSAPELAVSLTSSIKGDSAIAMGNVVGSNIMNLLVVLGFSALITPMLVKKSICKREIPFLIGATILLILFSFVNLFSGNIFNPHTLVWYEGIIFVLGIILFVYLSVYLAKKDSLKDPNSVEVEEIEDMPVWKAILYLLLGLAGIVVGAEFVTTPAKVIATSLGVLANLNINDVVNVVGLTVVAIGTSLPELVTSIVAAKKGENEIALGNVVGSNIFNILFICGLSSLAVPLAISANIITDMIISLVITVVVLLMCLTGKLSRKHGGILLVLYIIYLVYILFRLFNPSLALPL